MFSWEEPLPVSIVPEAKTAPTKLPTAGSMVTLPQPGPEVPDASRVRQDDPADRGQALEVAHAHVLVADVGADMQVPFHDDETVAAFGGGAVQEGRRAGDREARPPCRGRRG